MTLFSGLKKIQTDFYGSVQMAASPNSILRPANLKILPKRTGFRAIISSKNPVTNLETDELYFGGKNGFNEFNPGKIIDNQNIPPIVITDLQIFNKSIKPGTVDSPLERQMSQTRELRLSYKQTVFSFTFTALNYVSPNNNQYAYILEGFDKKWNYIGTRRSVTYTNLNPGQYTFRVKGSNNNNIWNETGTSVQNHHHTSLLADNMVQYCGLFCLCFFQLSASTI